MREKNIPDTTIVGSKCTSRCAAAPICNINLPSLNLSKVYSTHQLSFFLFSYIPSQIRHLPRWMALPTLLYSRFRHKLQKRSRQPTSRQTQKNWHLWKPWPAEFRVQPSRPREQNRTQPRHPINTARKRRHPERVTRHFAGCGDHEQGSPGQEERRYTEGGREADGLATMESVMNFSKQTKV